MAWEDHGTTTCANKDGAYSAHVKVKYDNLGNPTDVISTPVSDNKGGKHDHAWNVNTSNADRRPHKK